MGRVASFLVLSHCLALVGCLQNPTLAEPFDGGATESDEGGGQQTGECEDQCTLGEKRCTPVGESVFHEECMHAGDALGCLEWAPKTECAAAQECSADDGCHCPNPCELTGEFECSGAPRLCVTVGGCPTLIDACRGATCADAIADDEFCSGNPTHGLCLPCDQSGRACRLACPGTECYTCGGLGEP